MAVKYRDYYDVLGVPRTATPDDIKRAYRKLARAHHPDLKSPAERPKAAERFKEINEAYEVLRDADKRAKYDALGSGWQSGSEFTPPPGTEWHAGEAPFEGFGDFSDFFSALFGEAGARSARGGRRGARMQMAGSDAEAELPVSVEELLDGGRRRIGLQGGRTLDVEIPAGARADTVLRLAGQGGPGMNGGPPGDLYLHLRLDPNSRWRVQGDDLEADLPLWAWQAALGGEVVVDVPKAQVKLRIAPATQGGARLRLRGQGLPRRDGTRGDLHVVVRIVNPSAPNDAERAAFEALKRASTAPPDRPARP